MNYNFEEDIINYQFEPSNAAVFPNPLDYACNEDAPANRARNSLDSIIRHDEIPAAYVEIGQQDHDRLGIKKIFSSVSHENMFNADEDKLLAADNKFELSEEHRIMEGMEDMLELGSYLRERVTDAVRSNSDLEQNSQVEFVINSIDNDETNNLTLSEMFDETHESGSGNETYDSLRISREGLRKSKKTSACTMANSYRQRKTDD